MSDMLFLGTPAERLDRLIFSGRRKLTEAGVACWCPIGKHWMTFPLPAEVTEDWWREYSDAMIDDHERCDSLRGSDR